VGQVTPDVVGYRVIGRHGPLGVVVGLEPSDGGALLVVRGGASGALRYCVPSCLLRRRLTSRRMLVIEADVIDFTPRLRDDGSVDLLPIGLPGGDGCS
jgi:hypothetical protein